MSDNIINNISEADIEYTIVVKNMDDILSEVAIDDKERLLYESIIDNIERYASETVKAGKIAQLPSIGCIRKNPVRKVIQDNHENFRLARTHMTKEQYKEHVRETIIDSKIELAKLEKERLILKRIRSTNKAKYDKLYINIGKYYAEMFIKSILWLREVPFNIEFEEHYNSLKDK